MSPLPDRFLPSAELKGLPTGHEQPMLFADLDPLEDGLALWILLMDGTPLVAYYCGLDVMGGTDGATAISIYLLACSLSAFLFQGGLAEARPSQLTDLAREWLFVAAFVSASPVWLLLTCRLAALLTVWAWEGGRAAAERGECASATTALILSVWLIGMRR